jgi:hypothetical protein
MIAYREARETLIQSAVEQGDAGVEVAAAAVAVAVAAVVVAAGGGGDDGVDDAPPEAVAEEVVVPSESEHELGEVLSKDLGPEY